MTVHAEALALARRLAQADTRSAPECRRALLLYWYGSGATHLKAEQDALLDTWRRHGGGDHPLSAAIRCERERLGDAVAAVASEPHASAGDLRRIGTALTNHVRRLERDLVGAVERTLGPEERAQLDHELAGFAR
jgi:hypothetical protein